MRREIRSVSLSSDFFGGCKQPSSPLSLFSLHPCTAITWEHGTACRHTTTTRPHTDIDTRLWRAGEYGTEVAHGEANETYDMYSLSPFRSPGWRGGLYFAVGSFLASSLPHSRVYCELLVTTDHGGNCAHPLPPSPPPSHATPGWHANPRAFDL